MKKSVLLLGIIALSVMIIGFAAAQALPAPPVTTAQVGEFFRSLLVGGSAITEDVISRFLLAILIITVLAKPAYMITKNRSASIIVSSVVAILGIRFLTYQMIQGILLPYGAVAIVVSTFLVFALIAYFLTDITYPWIRKIGWIMLAVVFLGLWWSRASDIGDMTYVYLVTAGVSIGFFFLDGTFNNIKIKMRSQNKKDGQTYVQIIKMQKDIDDYTQLLPYAGTDTKEEKELLAQIKERQDKINSLLKTLGK